MKAEGCITVVGIVVLVLVLLFGIFNKYVFGNKQFVDLKQNYNVAYVMGDDNKFEKISIVKWNDWENSDAVQVVTPDGRAIYTHLRNVKLTRE
jgi:hypothetical protein